MIVPTHLSSIAKNIETKTENLMFSLKCCKCGCERFSLMQYKYSENDSDFEKYWDKFKVPLFSMELTKDKNGKSYWFGRTFFGIHVGKYYNKETANKDFQILKTQCTKCGEGYTIFDSRIHGCDALDCSSITEPSAISEDEFKKSAWEGELIVKLRYEIPFDDLKNDHGKDFDERSYSSAFTDITIYKNTNKKRRKVFEFETA